MQIHTHTKIVNPIGMSTADDTHTESSGDDDNNTDSGDTWWTRFDVLGWRLLSETGREQFGSME